MSAAADPVVLRHRDLEKIANVALRVGRVLMECGGRVRVVREGMRLTAQGLGAEVVGERVGYASLTLTVGAGEETITRMIDVGPHGVNYQLDVAVRRYATQLAEQGGAPHEVNETIDRLVRETRRHPLWLVAPATGLACAAFGRLLGVDWTGVPADPRRRRRRPMDPRQAARPRDEPVPDRRGDRLHRRRDRRLRRARRRFVERRDGVDRFDAAAGARRAGDQRPDRHHGRVPDRRQRAGGLGSHDHGVRHHRHLRRRSGAGDADVTLLSAQLVLDVAHQGAFGALAAWGFGVLFNFDWRSLIWCSALGALALGVRTLALAGGWSLEAASFAAALAAGAVVTLTSRRRGEGADMIALAGCIPMVPGAFFGKAILGLFAVTAPAPAHAEETAILAIVAMTRVILTLGAIGAGLAIPSQMSRRRGF